MGRNVRQMVRAETVKKQENTVENITSERNRLAKLEVFILNALGRFRGRFPFSSPPRAILFTRNLTQFQRELFAEFLWESGVRA